MRTTRRRFLVGMGVGGGMALIRSSAFAQTRMRVPGGGTVVVPAPYDRTPDYPTYGQRIADKVLVGYRNWRSTLSGQPECDGMIAVGRAELFETLLGFVAAARAGLSINWAAADRIPEQAWTENEQHYPVEQVSSQELKQKLSVHRVGFFDVYDDPATMVAVTRGGVHVGIWIANRNGGLKRGRKLAETIAGSFAA
jgi:hypothetical protein